MNMIKNPSPNYVRKRDPIRGTNTYLAGPRDNDLTDVNFMLNRRYVDFDEFLLYILAWDLTGDKPLVK